MWKMEHVNIIQLIKWHVLVMVFGNNKETNKQTNKQTSKTKQKQTNKQENKFFCKFLLIHSLISRTCHCVLPYSSDKDVIQGFTDLFPIFFICKSPSITQRSVSQENAFRKSKNPSIFFRRNIGSKTHLH